MSLIPKKCLIYLEDTDTGAVLPDPCAGEAIMIDSSVLARFRVRLWEKEGKKGRGCKTRIVVRSGRTRRRISGFCERTKMMIDKVVSLCKIAVKI